MNVLSLGPGSRHLFAIHDPAAATLARPRAAVICNPLGMEYVYAHRALRHLASRLARKGIHALRFDYYGTGDSAGDESEVTFDSMQCDVPHAMEAARDIAATGRVILIGLRLGASIAAQVASRFPESVESLILWDPLDELDVTRAYAARSLLLGTDDPLSAVAPSPHVLAVSAPCCWIEAITVSGALPVAIYQRIEEWLR